MERNHNDLPILIAQTGALDGQRWTINDALVIGRDGSCEIIVHDRQVSRFHARLMPASDGVILEDLGSKNGTYLNGQRLAEAKVMQDGDLIQIALAQHFVYLSSDATMPLDNNAVTPNDEPVYRLHLDNRSRRVWVNRQELIPPLSVQQFRLLHLLYENRDQLVSREELVEAIWGDELGEGVSEQAIDALVRRLRDRLASLDPGRAYILTVRGHGLRLDNPEESQV